MAATPLPEALTDVVAHGDFFAVLNEVPDGAVDFVFADLPYGITQNRWDTPIDLEAMWPLLWRVVKPDGAVALTAAQPFTSMLVASQTRHFKVEWVWAKTVGSGQLNIRHQPLRAHESVLLFYRRRPTYNPQMRRGTPYEQHRNVNGEGYGAQRPVHVRNEGTRQPTTVVPIPNPRIKGGHPTQKPVELPAYFIRTYTDPGDVVLDITAGAGTTAVAATQEGRHFLAVESDKRYLRMARVNVAAAVFDVGSDGASRGGVEAAAP